MPGLTQAAMTVGANAMKAVLGYAQLHSAPAGSAGTNNVTTAARKPITWGSTTEKGDFGLGAQVDFTGGTPDQDIYSITLWSASSGGTFYGEFIAEVDAAFNNGGDYSLTSLDLDGSSA